MSNATDRHECQICAWSTKHTPGPWETRTGLVYNHVVAAGRDTSEDIARISGHDTDPTAQANARLIAAAPELLEAAKVTLLGMERFLTQVGAASPEGFDLVGHWREADALRAAIAKAEGGN